MAQMTIGFAQAMEKLQAMTYAARQQGIDGGLIWLLKMDGWWQPKSDADYITPDRWRPGQ